MLAGDTVSAKPSFGVNSFWFYFRIMGGFFFRPVWGLIYKAGSVVMSVLQPLEEEKKRRENVRTLSQWKGPRR